MNEDLQAKWDARYAQGYVSGARPCAALLENAHLLPREGRALEIASGLGGNAVLLAERGLETQAWDISTIAIEKVAAHAAERALPLTAVVHDAVANPPAPSSFDVIVVYRFLDRSLAARLAPALRPGGLLYYQTFTREAAGGRGPSNPAYRLAPNELLSFFVPPLRLVAYREDGVIGDPDGGVRGEAWIVAQRDGP